MKVAILAGGRGTRLSEETDVRPKPMVEIGGKPILWHIMKYYESFGFDEAASKPTSDEAGRPGNQDAASSPNARFAERAVVLSSRCVRSRHPAGTSVAAGNRTSREHVPPSAQGASPASQSSSRTCLSRSVSMHCQKPSCL